VKDCPHHLDIRRLTAEQKEELIEDLMALKDTVEEEEVSQTSFGHISINSPSILTVSMATESP